MLDLEDLLAEFLLLLVGLSDLLLVLRAVLLKVIKELLVGSLVLALASAAVASASGHMLGAQLAKSGELLLNLLKFHLAILVNLAGLFFEDLLDFGLETAHIVAVVLLDDLLQLGLLLLQLRLVDVGLHVGLGLLGGFGKT